MGGSAAGLEPDSGRRDGSARIGENAADEGSSLSARADGAPKPPCIFASASRIRISISVSSWAWAVTSCSSFASSSTASFSAAATLPASTPSSIAPAEGCPDACWRAVNRDFSCSIRARMPSRVSSSRSWAVSSVSVRVRTSSWSSTNAGLGIGGSSGSRGLRRVALSATRRSSSAIARSCRRHAVLSIAASMSWPSSERCTADCAAAALRSWKIWASVSFCRMSWFCRDWIRSRSSRFRSSMNLCLRSRLAQSSASDGLLISNSSFVVNIFGGASMFSLALISALNAAFCAAMSAFSASMRSMAAWYCAAVARSACSSAAIRVRAIGSLGDVPTVNSLILAFSIAAAPARLLCPTRACRPRACNNGLQLLGPRGSDHAAAGADGLHQARAAAALCTVLPSQGPHRHRSERRGAEARAARAQRAPHTHHLPVLPRAGICAILADLRTTRGSSFLLQQPRDCRDQGRLSLQPPRGGWAR
eukprot:m.150903 g.150903  ORF g.150903 m.150903 type:complete len:478 (-) comp9750_c0_seq3:605-2038(-)